MEKIYMLMKEDFSFLNKYDFLYHEKIKSYIAPAIVFSKDNGDYIQIAFSYEDNKIHATLFTAKTPVYGESILSDVIFYGKSYKEQVILAVQKIKDFLNNNSYLLT